MKHTEDTVSTTPLEREIKFLEKFAAFYAAALLLTYLIFILMLAVNRILKLNLQNFMGSFTAFLIIAFVFPIFLSAFYTCRALYFLIRGNLEAFKLGILVMLACLLIGSGVCLANIALLGSS